MKIPQPDRTRLSIHWPAARSALLVGAFGAGALSLGLAVVFRAMESGSRAFVRQSVGDTAALLASQARLEIDRWSAELAEIGEARLKPAMLKRELEPGRLGGDAAVAADGAGTVEAPAEFVEVALWRRPEPGAAPRRAMLAVNSRSRAANPRWVEGASARATVEPRRLAGVFQGHRLVLAEAGGPDVPGGARLAFVAVPLGQGEVSEVVAAYVSLERLGGIFSSEPSERSVQAFLADGAGGVLVGDRDAADPARSRALLDWIRASGAPGGISGLETADGAAFTGGYRRVGAADVTVAASVPAAQADLALRGLRAQLLVFVATVFVGLFAGRYGYAARKRGGAPSAAAVPSAEAPAEPFVPRQALVVAMHGSLRGFNPLLETAGPAEAAEAVNDYLTLVAARIRASGGRFDRSPGVSFAATWEFEPGKASEAVEAAVGCATALGRDFTRFNELRKLDGRKPLLQGLGLHVGRALVARLGPAGEMRESAMGEAVACARALDRIGLGAGKDLVASHDVVSALPGLAKAAPLGEAKLTGDTGLTAYYALGPSGAASPAGLVAEAAPEAVARPSSETRVEIMTPAAARRRWLVNNGSAVVGPFTSEEIAARLFAQDFDFDCECWSEENGTSASIATSGMFSGVGGEGARLWIYDGATMHGPVSEAFARTAVERAAIPAPRAWVCEGSTAAGWTTLEAFLTARAAGSGRDPAAA